MLDLGVGRSAIVTATVTGDAGVPRAVEWTSRNPAIASVDAGGRVTANGRGTTYIVAEAVADRTRRDSVRTTVLSQLATGWTASRLGGPLIEDVASLWAPSANLAYAVNSLGDVYRWNGDSWSLALSGAQFGTTFLAVHGASPDAVVAVGTNGTIARFDGTVWSAMTSGTTATLRDVWVHAAGTAWAAGDQGTALRLTGSTWTAATPGRTLTLRAVWGSADLAYAVGDAGVIRRWSGGSWQAVASATSQPLLDVWSAANGIAYAVGAQGTVVRFNGSEFNPEVSGTTETLRTVAGRPDGASVIAAGDGVAITRIGAAWQSLGTPYLTRFIATSVDAAGGQWIGGQRGLVLYAPAGDAWRTLNLTPDLLDVWSTSAAHAIAVGELGFVFRYDGSRWTRQTSPTIERLNTVWASSATLAFAGGDNGVLLRYANGTWTQQASPTTSSIFAVWGAAADAVWAVTDGGEVLFWDGIEWSIEFAQGLPLFAVHGSSRTDVHAVGLDGTALYFDGSEWRARTLPGSPVLTGVWAAGDAGVIHAVGLRDFISRSRLALRRKLGGARRAGQRRAERGSGARRRATSMPWGPAAPCCASMAARGRRWPAVRPSSSGR